MQVKCPDSNAVLTPYLKEGSAKGTVLICPGGAYRFTSPREAAPVAKAFNCGGYHAFVLDYTTQPPPLGTRPLADAAWAMAYIRENAEEYRIDNDKIALCGFSAGGHLAGSLGVYWHRPEFFGGKKDPEMYRPNALILCYAVLSPGIFRHNESFENLAGDNGRYPWAIESQVSSKTPPTFLWHTAADSAVPVQNSLLVAEKLAAYSVPFELHIFPNGTHGLSLATEEVNQPEENRLADPHVAQWMRLCVNWLDITV